MVSQEECHGVEKKVKKFAYVQIDARLPQSS